LKRRPSISSRTAPETSTSPASAASPTRAAMLTSTPRKSPFTLRGVPRWTPARCLGVYPSTSIPEIPSWASSAAETACSASPKTAMAPSPSRLTTAPLLEEIAFCSASPTCRRTSSAASSPAARAQSEKPTRSVKTIATSAVPCLRRCASESACHACRAPLPISRIVLGPCGWTSSTSRRIGSGISEVSGSPPGISLRRKRAVATSCGLASVLRTTSRMPSESRAGSGFLRLRLIIAMNASSQGRNFSASCCFVSESSQRMKGSGSG
jgi:hypothetical protein